MDGARLGGRGGGWKSGSTPLLSLYINGEPLCFSCRACPLYCCPPTAAFSLARRSPWKTRPVFCLIACALSFLSVDRIGVEAEHVPGERRWPRVKGEEEAPRGRVSRPGCDKVVAHESWGIWGVSRKSRGSASLQWEWASSPHCLSGPGLARDPPFPANTQPQTEGPGSTSTRTGRRGGSGSASVG